MKQKLSLPLTLSLLLVSTQSFAIAQERADGPTIRITPARSSTQTSIGRRAGRFNSIATPVIEKDFEEALQVIQDHYVDGRKLDYNQVFKSSILGMLRSLDPHSSYYDREEYEELKTEQRSEYFGIGASIQNYLVRDTLDTYITSTFRGSPAWRGGLRYGDRIVAVDGVKMTGKTSLEVRNRIRGPRGSVVRVTVERASDRKTQVVSITRDSVAQPSVPDAYMIQPGVGYIDMTRGFNYTTSDELREALDVLQSKGATSLVLDLRNNPGGFLDQAIRVAEVFLPYGQLILTQKGRNGLRENTYRSRNRSADSTPLVILINESTASASEIVAGAMQDHDRALIVGETSFGKGLVQSIIPLDYGGGLTLTSAKYYTPSGRLIQRDYSDHGLYDYFTQGGSRRNGEKKPVGPERKTDTGRAVYGGGGITPDEPVQVEAVTTAQRRLVSPLFGFTRDLVNGRIPGMGHYRVPGGINFNHELQSQEFTVDRRTLKAFEDYLAGDPALAKLAPLVRRNRSFIQLQLRYNVVTAAYGRTMADRVLVVTEDEQIARAIEVLPRAKDLAMAAMSRR
ncbi:MAG TPA: S41 family peptidase [Pyrinomonadaceae bacterium]|nr:S41 family peptidase [Pyrinomonadaceae bacterium]